jgi:PAS domain S-box-containing protein
MAEPAGKHSISKFSIVTLFLFALCCGILVYAGRSDYPDLHTILDTCTFLLSSVLAMLFWDIGNRIENPFPKWIASSFAVAALLAFVHMMVTVEWSGPFVVISELETVLRPSTWSPTMYILPIGIGASIVLLHYKAQRVLPFFLLLFVLAGLFLLIFHELPRYTYPTVFGITRPTLIFVPVLWIAVAYVSYRYRRTDRLLPAISLMAIVSALANFPMLYSRAAHDTLAMIAHVGSVCAYLTLLISATQMTSHDTGELIRADKRLAEMNEELEIRVRDRTEKLEKAKKLLEEEIGERLKTTEAFVEIHNRTRAMFDCALDGIISMDHEGKIKEFNPAAERIFGYTRAKVLDKILAETIIPPELRELHFEGLQRYLETGEASVLGTRIEVSGMRSDGSLVPIELAITRMPGTGPPMFTAFLRDIAERRQSDKRMHSQLESLNLLQQITRAIAGGHDLGSIYEVVLQNLEENLPAAFGCILEYDPASSELTVLKIGINSSQLSQQLGIEQKTRIEVDSNGLNQFVTGNLVYEKDISQPQTSFFEKLASCGLHSLVAAPLIVESSIIGILLIARESAKAFTSAECEFLLQLSEHVALAAQEAKLHTSLQLAYDDLRQTQEAVMQQERLRAFGQMASGIAHDINNAISPIMIYTEFLLELEPGLSMRAREFLEIMKRAVNDVAQTVSRLREFYRHPEPQLSMNQVQLNHIVQQVIDLTNVRWRDMPQQMGIVIQTQTELESTSPTVMGIESEMREALINLVFNAVDAMPEGGTLTIRTAKQNSTRDTGINQIQKFASVEVIDTGVGMTEETRIHCLEPFYTTKGERGTGLGLAMVYGVAQRHSADIEIESVVNKGTTVRIVFPAVDLVREGALKEVPSKVMDRLKILVVDDDPLVLESLRALLDGEGHITTAANGGQAGIEMFMDSRSRNDFFEIVITDLGMPHVDGRRVSTFIKTTSPDTPVILLTGWGQKLLDSEIPDYVDLVLSKPPKLQELRQAIAHCVQLRNN